MDIAIIGFGKIARDQHLPAIAANSFFRLAAAVSPEGGDAGCPMFKDHREMLRQVHVDAVAICTPPGPRFGIARDCIAAGLHVLLEKPPCATLGEVEALRALQQKKRGILFTTWHAQYNRAVGKAADLIEHSGLRDLRIEWLEDVEKWHPGQDWIWAPGGFGVFDAGINALSIATLLVPGTLLLRSAKLTIPLGRQQPIAAELDFDCASVEGSLSARLNWRQKGEEVWTIEGHLADGRAFRLFDGGKSLELDGSVDVSGNDDEYPEIYERFAQLVRQRHSHVDVEPLRLMADVFLKGERLADNA